MYEVEQKFYVDDAAALHERLAALGATLGPPMTQVDIYFAHPARDFGQTDEALRLRQVGDLNYVTYKGPKLDTQTKTRREIEVPLAPGHAMAGQMAELLEAIGFVPHGTVRKQRRPVTILWQHHQVAGALDEIDRLGAFFELELAADASGLGQARAAIASLAAELGLSRSERRSYLELLAVQADSRGD